MTSASNVLAVLIVASFIAAVICESLYFAAVLRGDLELADRVAWRTGWVLPVALLLQAIDPTVTSPVLRPVKAVVSAFFLWLWWNRHRKNRRRLAAKATSVVRDLGHRLTVAPVPATGQVTR